MDQSEYASPLLRLCGLVLERRPPPKSDPAGSTTAMDISPLNPISGATTRASRLAGYGLTVARFVFLGSLIALKVFEWVTMNNGSAPGMTPTNGMHDDTAPEGRTGGMTGPSTLRPPQQMAPPSQGCPICARNPPVNPTATYTGYVFCYSCVVPHIKVNNTCPVTGLPCNDNQLRKLVTS